MVFTIGQKYLFMTQRYAFSGTVELVTPTHAVLGADAEIHYEDIGGFEDWSRGAGPKGKPVPGQRVSLLGTDATPIRNIV